MSFSSYDDSRRNIVANKLHNIVNDVQLSRQIEQSIYNYTIKQCLERFFSSLNEVKIRKYMANLPYAFQRLCLIT